MSEEKTFEEVTGEQQEQQAGISVDDVLAMHQIVDVCVKRGAINAGEMSHVGAVFDRVGAFLKSVIPQEAPVKPEAQVEGAEESKIIT